MNLLAENKVTETKVGENISRDLRGQIKNNDELRQLGNRTSLGIICSLQKERLIDTCFKPSEQ